MFERIPDLKINKDKTNVVYIGSLCKKKENPGITSKTLKWIKDGRFSALGVNFSTNLPEMVEINYNNVMKSVKASIQHWSKRNLTVLGRITLVKSLITPKFSHLVLAIPSPPKALL